MQFFFETNDHLKTAHEQKNTTSFEGYKHGGKGAFCINEWENYVNYSVLFQRASLNVEHDKMLRIIKADDNYDDTEEIAGFLSYGSIEFFCTKEQKEDLTYQETCTIIEMLNEIKCYSSGENGRSIPITFANTPFQKIGLVHQYSSEDIDLIIEVLERQFMNQQGQYMKKGKR